MKTILIILIILVIIIIYIKLNFYKNNINNINNKNNINNIKYNIKYNNENIDNNNNNNNLYYFRNNFCGLINKKLFENYNILKTTNLDICNLYIPSTYTHCENEFKNIYNKQFYIYMINGCDCLASKNMLYKILYINLNTKLLNKIVPETWIINDKKQIDLFIKNFNKNNIYILKKNVQQKKGIYLTNNYTDIINNMNKYNVIQKYINDTFLINNRKITLRIYLLIVYKNEKLDFYVHQNGKCLYTTKNYNKLTNIKYLNLNSNYNSFITSTPNNLNLDIYKINPHTLKDLKKYLNKNNYNYDLLYNNIIKNIKIIKKCFIDILYKKNKMCSNICFQLFRLDYIFNNKLDTFLLEINKGPNMTPVSKKDYKLKYNIIEDVFDKVNFINKNNINLFNKI